MAAPSEPTPCPSAHLHTEGPPGYIDRAEWAAAMARTHTVERCPGCGLWKVWRPKVRRPARSAP